MVKPIVPHYGSPVTGAQRFGRAALEQRFDSVMTETSGASLFGLRRIGKSSEALACRERLAAAGGVVLYIDAQGFASEAQLLMAVLEALPAKGWRERAMKAIAADNTIAKVARDALAKAAGTQADVQAYFAPIAAAVEHALQAEDRVTLAIDEFPWLCRNILQGDTTGGRHRVDLLLATLRRWRVKGARMMLMGSVGMAALGRAHQLDLSHHNDLTPLDVPPLAPDEAQALVAALVLGSQVQGWTPGHTQALMDESVALYPAIVQRGFQAMKRGLQAVPLAEVAAAFDNDVRPNLDQAFYTQFDRRRQLYRQLPAPTPTLLEVLLKAVLAQPTAEQPYPALCAAAGPAAQDADIGDALAILREDGFLALRAPRGQPQLWRPASGLVTAWWQQRRGG